jgi:EAL domain-containing protein (putative c-di-GMP-specific phosphodiesterase class I)
MLKSELTDIIFNGEFYIFIQPIVDNKYKKVYFKEALCRIKGYSNIDISKFIIRAEEAKLIHLIDQKIFDIVVKRLNENKEEIISVNISKYTILKKEIIEYFIKKIEDYNLSQRLFIEITESFFTRNTYSILHNTKLLADKGIKIFIDDFGLGYSPIFYLKLLPIHGVKISSEFIYDIISNKKSQIIVKNLVSLAKDLDIKLVSEFVDNEDLLNFLSNIGIRYMQGNYLEGSLVQI